MNILMFEPLGGDQVMNNDRSLNIPIQASAIKKSGGGDVGYLFTHALLTNKSVRLSIKLECSQSSKRSTVVLRHSP